VDQETQLKKSSIEPKEGDRPLPASSVSRLKKFLLRLFAVIFSLVALACAALLVVTLLFGDKVKQFAISEINKKLATEMKVEGPISFSVFAHFPYASVTFEKVSIIETLPAKGKLLSCDEISLLINLSDLWKGQYVIHRLTAENGTLRVHIDKDGNRNYDLIKKSAGPQKEFSLKINAARFRNFQLNYLDEPNEQDYSLLTGVTKLTGDFASEKFTLDMDADAVTSYLKSHGVDYLHHRTLLLRGQIDCEPAKNYYVFRSSQINIDGSDFTLSGEVTGMPDGPNLALQIGGSKQSVNELLALLPAETIKKLSAYQFSGRISWSGEITGLMNEKTVPLLTAKFLIDRGIFGTGAYEKALTAISMDGRYTNGSDHKPSSSEIVIDRFSADVAGNELKGSFVLHNFSNPEVNAMLNGKAELEKLYTLFKNENVESVSGSVTFHRCYYRGAVSALNSTALNLNKIQAGGQFEVNDLKVVTPQATYDRINGTFEIANNDIRFKACTFSAGESDLQFKGIVSNFFPFLFTELSDSATLRQKIGVDVTLTSDILNWEDLVGKSSSRGSQDNYEIPAVFYRLAGSVSGVVKEFSYKKFHAAGISGKVLFLPHQIYFNNIRLSAENGTAGANGTLDISQPNRSRLDAAISLQQLDLTRLFYEFDNFNQSTLTDKNLKGKITADISLQAMWNENRFNADALHAVADVRVENGELNNFEPMMALATFIKVKELRNITFSKMQNQIEIKNRKVLIPAMDIFSSALNVHLSGTHGFDNVIDYKVQLNLLRLLTDKFRKSNNHVNEAEQTTEGFLNLYLTMTGPATDPVIKYDRQAVKQKIATDLAQEKQNLKEILKKEFSQQSATPQEAKDWKTPDALQYFEFEPDSASEMDDSSGPVEQSATKKDQQKAFEDFKSIFKKQPKDNH
jgi:hypothetical protein